MGRVLPLVAFGAALAQRGILAKASLVIAALTVVGAVLAAIALTASGSHAPLHDVPLLASSALAWGGGFLLAFSAAAHALRRDRSEGIHDLVLARTGTLRGYLVARVGGLAGLLAIVIGGGTLVSGLAAALASAHGHGAVRALQAPVAGVVFGVAFAIVVAPVALAALGARSRVGGYLFLLVVVVMPELLVHLLARVIPGDVAEVLSIPSALGALRASLAPGAQGTISVLRAVRALVALGVFTAIATALVRRDVLILEEPEARP